MLDLTTVDILDHVKTPLRKVAGTHGGEYAGPCPLCGGRDRFRVWPDHPGGRGRFWCRQCDAQGDTVDLLRQRDGLDFAGACQVLGLTVPPGAPRRRGRRRKPARPARPTPTATATPPTWDPAHALALVHQCQAALFDDAGAKARAWLLGRGISEDTARAWGLGYSAGGYIGGLWVPRGVVLPWLVGGEPWAVKVRRPVPPLPGRKYTHVKGGGSHALYGLDHLAGRGVVVVCEGELDAVLLWQHAGDLVDVVAVGSATDKPSAGSLARLAGAARWLVALDRDAAGDKGASWWGEYSARVRRVRPLQGHDIGYFAQVGGDLRAWVSYHLARLEAERTPRAASPVVATTTTWVDVPLDPCPRCGGATWRRPDGGDALTRWACTSCGRLADVKKKLIKANKNTRKHNSVEGLLMDGQQQHMSLKPPAPEPPAQPSPAQTALARELTECRDAVHLAFAVLQDLDKRLAELAGRLTGPGSRGGG